MAKFVEKISLNLTVIINFIGLTGYLVLITVVISLLPDVVDRGIPCHDPKILYPFKEEIIPDWGLVVFSVLPVGAVLAITNYFIVAFSETELKEEKFFSKPISVRKVLGKCWSHNLITFLIYNAGLMTSYMLIDIAKSYVGSYRPHFLARCKPNGGGMSSSMKPSWKSVNCTENSLIHLKDFNCSVEDSLMLDSMKSFPSGHATCAFYCATFGIFYLEKFLRRFLNVCLLKSFLQTILLSAAWVIAFSRVCDNYHSLEDVLVGTLIGSVMGYFIVSTCFTDDKIGFWTCKKTEDPSTINFHNRNSSNAELLTKSMKSNNSSIQGTIHKNQLDRGLSEGYNSDFSQEPKRPFPSVSIEARDENSKFMNPLGTSV